MFPVQFGVHNEEQVTGDARLSLERELEQQDQQDFDVLVIDAFSGDAIPVHLLTIEAFEIYIRHLKNPFGILSIHITNRYLDLRPVVFSAARHFGLKAFYFATAGDGWTSVDSSWVLLTKGDKLRESVAWTDDYSNLLQILNR